MPSLMRWRIAAYENQTDWREAERPRPGPVRVRHHLAAAGVSVQAAGRGCHPASRTTLPRHPRQRMLGGHYHEPARAGLQNSLRQASAVSAAAQADPHLAAIRPPHPKPQEEVTSTRAIRQGRLFSHLPHLASPAVSIPTPSGPSLHHGNTGFFTNYNQKKGTT